MYHGINYKLLFVWWQAHILAIKPHSADVERLISYYNILKSHNRSSLAPETIKNFHHVKLNMCTLN